MIDCGRKMDGKMLLRGRRGATLMEYGREARPADFDTFDLDDL